ncbi:MAG: hypothetical protein KIT84_23505 [Labilithrix sp.]|nr:hypothetical protein [Labilithrix sp.]MCW5814015.1 hypothetical protein [Labilithrix sp.]
MIVLTLIAAVLVIRLAVMRTRTTTAPSSSSRRAWMMAAVAVVLALSPFLVDAALLAGPRSRLLVDTSSHLAIAQDIARAGLPHGWIPTYNGGFPFALHYPPLPWLVTAVLLRIGVHPVVAVKGLGLAAFLAAPILILLAGHLSRIRAFSAAAAAISSVWVAPYTQFTGGWEPFFAIGLLSQVLVVPIAVAWVATLTRRWRFELAPLLAGLCAATHPQVFTVMAPVLVAGAVATWQRPVVGRALRSVLGGGLVAAALYLPGIASMEVPFGWPPNLTWRHVGFGASRMFDSIVDGDLLDYKHTPVVGAMWGAATVVLVLRWKLPRSRALLTASCVTLAMASIGPALASTGAFGSALLSIFQPMRALALIPLIAAASIAVALDELAAWIVALTEHIAPRARELVRAALPSLLIVGACLTLPTRVERLHRHAVELSRDRMPDGCAPLLEYLDTSAVERWLSSAPYGRTAFESSALHACAASHGAVLPHSGALASSYGAGAHVGVNLVAFDSVDPEFPMSAGRAESLGIRSLVHTPARRPGPATAWELVEASGGLQLSRRLGGTDFVGVACVREALRGREKDLSAELHSMFAAYREGARLLDDPRELVVLESENIPLAREALPADGCDANLAKVLEEPREPGAFEAEIETSTPVDVVFRATAYRGWEVRERHQLLPTRRVAPGFFSVRVAPGRHRLEASARMPRGYGVGLGFATGALLILVLLGDERGRKYIQSVGESLRTWCRWDRHRGS